ncbi:hypothetical protein E4U17_000301 [Claviceps sp. LM77 group G4]|nr:hypothetical protein E4U17_000301 [Claviceps sp. LM77 group G4]KAG6070722.1 hypothetical protein E4U33_004059 [Claviceps sp. LM78 group G4]KAG6074162.1 hypothetical protein E4U16_004192 [Claviceps sp. LM84 group G4]
MSDQTIEFIEEVHKRHGRAITTKALLINDYVTATEWAEMFASDVSAGKEIIPSDDDDESFKEAERREAALSDEEGSPEPFPEEVEF